MPHHSRRAKLQKKIYSSRIHLAYQGTDPLNLTKAPSENVFFAVHLHLLGDGEESLFIGAKL